MATRKGTSKPRSAAKAPAKRGPGRPRKDGSPPRRKTNNATFEPYHGAGPLNEMLPPAFRALSASTSPAEVPPVWMKPGCENIATATRTIDDAFFELQNAIEGMALLTDDESEALDYVLRPEPPRDSVPESTYPESKLAAQITDAARRIQKCNAYRRARLARIDLPRG